jgi:hypothetical protein
MSWTVACFCGTVFDAPADRCPTCNTLVPAVTRGASAGDSAQLPDAVEELVRSRLSGAGQKSQM